MKPELPRLIVITDWSLGRERLLSAVARVVELGARVAVQHRHPAANTRVFLDEARELQALCEPARVPLFVNGRVDVALLLGAHLHLPAHGPRVADVRPLLPKQTWISAAVHDEREADEARGADLVVISPVFGAGSKPGDTRATLGPGGFETLAGRAGCPGYALGGVTSDTVGLLGETSALGIASVTAVVAAPDPLEAARSLLDALTCGDIIST